MGPGPPELARSRRIAHIGRPAEDQHLDAGGIHGIEQFPSPLVPESREVDAAALLEGHDPGHGVTANGS